MNIPLHTPREESIHEAVNFLNDPRVKGSDPSKAVSFLRSKGITDAELAEAYRRCGVPFPSAGGFSSPTYARHPPPFHPPGHRGSSWTTVFWGVTAAAGVYAAGRELLKRYVVPMYFPEAARVGEERRRRDEQTMRSQEAEIGRVSRLYWC